MGIEELLSRLAALIPADAAWTQGGDEGRGNFRCENCVACEDCKFCRDCQQCRACTYCEGCEQCEGCTQCRRCIACADSSYLEDSRACRNSSYLLLCLGCEDSVHCLGCVGLSGAEFCILNEQMTRQAYFSQVRALRAEIEAMVDQGWRIDQLVPGVVSDLAAASAPSSAARSGSVEAMSKPALRPDSKTGSVKAHSPAAIPEESARLSASVSESPSLQREATKSSVFTPDETHESQSPAPTPSPEEVKRALAIEKEAERLALDASRSFEARLARLQSPQPTSSRPAEPNKKAPLWRSRIQAGASTPASTLPSRDAAAAHPALAAYRDLTPSDLADGDTDPKPGADQEVKADPLANRASDLASISTPEPSSAPRSDFDQRAPVAPAEIGESLDRRRRERYRQAAVEQAAGSPLTAPEQLRARPLPNARGPASWRASRGDREPSAGAQNPSSWVPRGDLPGREHQEKRASPAPTTPNRLLAFVKSGAAPLSKDEETARSWTPAKLPPRKNR